MTASFLVTTSGQKNRIYAGLEVVSLRKKDAVSTLRVGTELISVGHPGRKKVVGECICLLLATNPGGGGNGS